MGESTWTARKTSQTVTIGVGTLADAAVVQSTAEIDNSSDKDLFCALMLKLAIIDWSEEDNPAFYIWFLDNIDGTQETYNTAPARMPDAIIPIEAVNAAQNVIVRGISIPPISFDIVVQNKSGATTGTTTLEIETYGVTTA